MIIFELKIPANSVVIFYHFRQISENQWKWRYLDFWQPAVTNFYDFGNFCQNWSIGITPGLGMLTNHDANDAYLDKDNFIRTRKCEIIFWARKLKLEKSRFFKMSRCLSDNDIHYILLRLEIIYLHH